MSEWVLLPFLNLSDVFMHLSLSAGTQAETVPWLELVEPASPPAASGLAAVPVCSSTDYGWMGSNVSVRPTEIGGMAFFFGGETFVTQSRICGSGSGA